MEMDSKMTPIVSIIMASFNRSNYLESTITNIFNQDYGKIELIVINDGSSDDTISVLQHLQTIFEFIIINNSENLGLQKSLNIGVKRATGKYLARIDDHDTWLNVDKLTQQVDFLEKNPEFGLIGTGYKVGNKNMINPLSDSEIRNQLLMRSPFCHVSVVMLKSVFDKVGGYDESLPYSEDWDLWLKIGKHTKLANLPTIAVAIQEEDRSLSQAYFLKQLPINRQIVKRYYKDYPKYVKAFLYHQFLRFFFVIFPVNGSFHRMMKYVFLKVFRLAPKRNTSYE